MSNDTIITMVLLMLTGISISYLIAFVFGFWLMKKFSEKKGE